MRHDPFGLLAFLHWNHPWNDHHFDKKTLKKALAQLKDLGISTIRTDILWSDVHAGEYKYNFSTYDELIPMVADEGIQLLALLHYNKTDYADKRETWNHPPDSFEEFGAYVSATVARYKKYIHYWEIWNEPNLAIYWVDPTDHLEKYSKLLKISYAEAKKADPACIVLNGGLTEPLVESVTDLYKQGCKDFFDILSIHTFFPPLDPQSESNFHQRLHDIESIMKKNADQNKKIWITEMGAPGVPPEKNPCKNWWAGENPNMKQQADALENQFRWIKQHPMVEKLFWAFYRDTDGMLKKGMFADGTDFLGLVRNDLTPKPAFHRLKELIAKHK